MPHPRQTPAVPPKTRIIERGQDGRFRSSFGAGGLGARLCDGRLGFCILDLGRLKYFGDV
jgi:hypothetical protein